MHNLNKWWVSTYAGSIFIKAAKSPISLTPPGVNARITASVFNDVSKYKIITKEEKNTIAFHEAGHAIVSWLLEHAAPLVKVTIVPRGQSLGAAWYLPEERMIVRTEQMLDEMCATLGGRAAEKIMFNKISTGALSDLEKVTKQARAIVSVYGLNDKIGNITYYDSSGQGDYNFTKPYSEETARKIDEEISLIIEKQYKKAFIQEKAILSREEGTYYQLIELARLTEKSGDFNLASSIYNFIIERCPSIDIQLLANQKSLNIKVNDANKEQYSEINLLYETLILKYNQNRALVPIIIDYARFLCFEQGNSVEATSILKEKLKISYPITSVAQIKLALGDILVYQERFDEALIYYTQVQLSLKNSPIAQEARFRVAKTSFYKGDFKWAETQLKVLKSSISQLIANDALELKLVISDHKYEDSLQVALNAFSKASLLQFQNKTTKAIEVLSNITENHKEEAIVDDAIFKMGSIYETQKKYDKAIENYTKIIEEFKESILLDDAYYRLGILYETIFNNTEEAKRCYEYILFNLENSIHLVESRKRYRNLIPDIW